jgi:putative membrane protein
MEKPGFLQWREKIMRFLLRWAINAIALYVSILVVNSTIGGIVLDNPHWTSYIWMALIFGLVNALVRPVLQLLTCPLIILTLGLFTLILNTILFYLVGYIGTFFGVGFTVQNFWAAFFAAVLISVVSVVLTMLLKDARDRRNR